MGFGDVFEHAGILANFALPVADGIGVMFDPARRSVRTDNFVLILNRVSRHQLLVAGQDLLPVFRDDGFQPQPRSLMRHLPTAPKHFVKAGTDISDSARVGTRQIENLVDVVADLLKAFFALAQRFRRSLSFGYVQDGYQVRGSLGVPWQRMAPALCGKAGSIFSPQELDGMDVMVRFVGLQVYSLFPRIGRTVGPAVMHECMQITADELSGCEPGHAQKGVIAESAIPQPVDSRDSFYDRVQNQSQLRLELFTRSVQEFA